MESDTRAHTVLSDLVYQLLDAKTSILRDQPRSEALMRKFSDAAWCADIPEAAFDVLIELLKPFPEAYIFLDRVDRIKGDPDRFIDPLVDLIKR